MLSLLENLTGQEFVDYVSAHNGIATSFSLSKSRWPTAANSRESARILNELSPYLIQTVYAERWFGQCVPKDQKMEIYIFRFTNESKRILLFNYDSIFYNGVVWNKPEDLCFFKGSKLISGSLTHENICYVYDEKMHLPGVWEKLSSNQAEQICIPE